MVKRTGGALLLSVNIDRTPGTIGNQLYAAIRDLIHTGGLNPGERLPATRTLAKDLRLSRTTVVSVFDRLTSEGLIESRTGAGTYVSDAMMATRPKPPLRRPGQKDSPIAVRSPKLSHTISEASRVFGDRLPHEVKAFTTALPAFDVFPRATWMRLMNRHWRSDVAQTLEYADPCGHRPLREAIASHLISNRGIKCDPEQIFIVGGAQQAFQLIANILLDPGDKVWFENPGAIGARNCLVACGARLVAVPVDEEGMSVRHGLSKARSFKLAFVTPSHQHPLGASMSLDRRFALLQAAEDANAFIIEDDYDGEFRYSGHPLPTLKSIDLAGRVIYVGTFSKTLFPALRLGFIVSPPALIDVFNHVSQALLPGVATAPQAVVTEFMQNGHFATHIRRMRRIYSERHQVLYQASAKYLEGLMEVKPTDTGLHTIGCLPVDVREEDAASAARRKGIIVAPIGRFCIAPTSAHGLVLGFSGIKPAQIVAGVKALTGVLKDLRC